MVTIVIKRNDGSTTEIENVVAWDCFTKEHCEDMVGRELTEQELFDIEEDMNDESEVTSDVLQSVIAERFGGDND